MASPSRPPNLPIHHSRRGCLVYRACAGFGSSKMLSKLMRPGLRISPARFVNPARYHALNRGPSGDNEGAGSTEAQLVDLA